MTKPPKIVLNRTESELSATENSVVGARVSSGDFNVGNIIILVT